MFLLTCDKKLTPAYNSLSIYTESARRAPPCFITLLLFVLNLSDTARLLLYRPRVLTDLIWKLINGTGLCLINYCSNLLIFVLLFVVCLSSRVAVLPAVVVEVIKKPIISGGSRGGDRPPIGLTNFCINVKSNPRMHQNPLFSGKNSNFFLGRGHSPLPLDRPPPIMKFWIRHCPSPCLCCRYKKTARYRTVFSSTNVEII